MMTYTKFLFLILLGSLYACNSIKSKPKDIDTKENSASFYNIKVNTIEGEEVKLSKYKGKKILIINTASKCGYTPQYEDLQQLHEEYKDDVVLLGFPANNFGKQEPGKNEEIATFCKRNYGVSFQMMEKVSVKGDDSHPLYQWLSKKKLNGWNEQAPTWNFCKYLISENGELLDFFESGVKPLDPKLISAIQKK